MCISYLFYCTHLTYSIFSGVAVPLRFFSWTLVRTSPWFYNDFIMISTQTTVWFLASISPHFYSVSASSKLSLFTVHLMKAFQPKICAVLILFYYLSLLYYYCITFHCCVWCTIICGCLNLIDFGLLIFTPLAVSRLWRFMHLAMK